MGDDDRQMAAGRRSMIGALVMAASLFECAGFKAGEFKKCSDSSFCRRLRGKAGDVYALQSDSLRVEGAKLVGKVVNEANQAQFDLTLTSYGDTVRLLVDEAAPNHRYQLPWVLLPELAQREMAWAKHSKALLGGKTTLQLSGGAEVTLTHRPLAIEARVGGKPALRFNSEGLLNYEHRREKQESDGDGLFEETFKSHTDSKPKGPQGIGFDVAFPGSQHVYGIPQHATSLALKATVGDDIDSEPFRLYNLDVFEYEHDSPFGLYGSVPYVISHKSDATVGAFWHNAAEMLIDVTQSSGGVGTRWIADSGILDLFLLLGPNPTDVMAQYARLTGPTAMPQLFALGYHQCRWNYRDEADTLAVDAGFDSHNIPFDVIWLDIEHTDGKRYMTWDKALFPKPEELQNNIASRGRKMVTIVDPHIKRDPGYPIFKAAEDKGYYVKNKDGKDYDGWCWPGSSSYLDVMSPEVRSWWATQFLPGGYPGATPHLYIWNDMNEPSVFNGPETTMPKDNLHHGGAEHRDIHNLYGTMYHEATAQGLIARGTAVHGKDGDRPFVLSRAFFSGTQRVGPIWTGDNTADWRHLRVSIPMVLSINLAGIAFSGADVGGFFGNPDAQLMVRWYQLGAFYPFFRGHAHLETARREPWLFGEETTTRIRTAIRSRYALLPYLYTLFRHASLDGQPVMRPLWFEFPEAASLFAVDDQFMLGPALLVAPVLDEGVSSRTVTLPAGPVWHDAATGEVEQRGGSTFELPVTMDTVPAYLRGGHIIARRERARRSTAAMHGDPLTLVVVLDGDGSAEGDLYMDDGRSFAFQRGAFLHRRISFADGKLSSALAEAARGTALTLPLSGEPFKTDVVVERIVVLGLTGGPSGWKVKVAGSAADLTAEAGPLRVQPAGPDCALVVRKPELRIDADWTLQVYK